ncbi:peptide/nickel transport system permease protein [Actinocorallia herbida]|uniref:Peptide/nickel transport system permease protein n=1 Tax=Actinocorallia herbida TaxID=58109 RepID=A0A3N1D2E1_9ACTN|nr:ABC transporter permease [Actinocorallia herbida]ROO87703.1 peptide/nickel transport system permease protein [Actinocorallia herbida]
MITPRYVGRRLALALAQVAAVASAVFLLSDLLPGDAAVIIAGDDPDPERIAQIRQALGLDRPLSERFTDWLGGLLRGDLGHSLVSDRPVSAILGEALGPTLLLASATLALLLPLAAVLGVAAALREGGRFDKAFTAIAVGLYAVPEFALAIVFITALSGILPVTALGGLTPAAMVPPVAVMLARPLCSLSRLVRAGMIGALHAGYTAHPARLGVPARRVRYLHALPNAVTPAVQQLARTVDWLLGGVIIVEAVFVVPGLGTVLADAVADRDLPVLQGLALVFAATTVLANLTADFAAFRLAPRA